MCTKISDIFEFILWDNCNNNCTFCWQKLYGHISSTSEKINSFLSVLTFLESPQYKQGSHILIVGGEIFDQSIKQIVPQFEEFWNKIINYQLSNHIDLVYINTNLLYTDLTYIQYVLNLANKHNIIHRIKFTTSYDYIGRFNTPHAYSLFASNLRLLVNTYDRLNCVINTILTRQFCEYQLNNPSFISYIQSSFTNRTTVNFLPYISIDKNLIPVRSTVFKVLLNEEKSNPGFLSTYVNSMSLDQTKHVYKIIDGKCVDNNCELASCGHPTNFQRYSSHNTCFICDLRSVMNVD